jgi:predicted amidohydrolase YtcJ
MVDGVADLVFVGATVESIAPRAVPADAVAVRDGRIVAVGATADVRELIGPRTDVVELQGETLLPGFQDAHVHPIGGGLLADRCDLHDLPESADAYLEAIGRYAAAHPDRSWILGSGWALSAFLGEEPRREELDRVVGDRPVLLESNDGHCAWVSSAALRLAGVTAATEDPRGGRITRDEHGEPAGTLLDVAVNLVAGLVPEPSHAELVEGLRNAQRQLHRLGITAWQDAWVTPAYLAAYRQAAEEGWLTARVTAALWWEREQGLEQIEAFEELRRSAAVGRLKAGSVKLMLDGILESRTAYMVDPYTGTSERGVPFIDPGLLLEAVAELDRRGFQAHFHAIGDGAVRLALDAVEEARRRNGPTDGRHHAAHLEVVNPDDVPRFAPLGMTANIQPFWAADDAQMQELRIPILGPERAEWQYVFRSLCDAGARLAGGSDWTVTTANPLLEMEVATRRVYPSTRDMAPFTPAQRLTLDEALAAFTIGSAYANHLDGETGTIEVGKMADLVLLDRDIRPTEFLGDATVVTTYVEGERV